MRFIIEKIKGFIGDETGASVIEVAVIIVVLVIVALVFKEQLEAILVTVMGKVSEKISGM